MNNSYALIKINANYWIDSQGPLNSDNSRFFYASLFRLTVSFGF